ncbi:uncharacterized protein LOC117641173 [Thrips palmi]|uniref:Odorant receptor n=1 Tax=Thrips palmi TaxID=161013 RepID=A0A6P8ZIU3_THRPL|nr:uncharacterized protein LOC117641173 [Thrips palmi]
MALEVVERLLRLACSWPEGRNRLRYWIGVYLLPYSFAFTIVLPAACFAAGMHASAMDRVDLLTDGVATSLCFVKLRCLQRHASTLLEVRRLLRDHFTPLEETVVMEAREANKRCERRAGRLAIGYVALYSSLSICGSIIMFFSLISGKPEDRRLTTKAPQAFLHNDYLFWPVLCGISVELYIFPIATGTFDALFLTLSLHLVCKCNILWVLLRRAQATDHANAPNRIRDCVIYHQLIIRLHKLTEGIFSGVTLYQMIYILFGVGTPGIRILNGSLNGDTSKTLFAISYVWWNICQLLTFCWFGDKVAKMSLDLSDGAFWTFEPWQQRSGHHLHLMMLRAQKPLYLTAGRFTNLTLRLCLDIMKRSYSLYSAMNRIKTA